MVLKCHIAGPAIWKNWFWVEVCEGYVIFLQFFVYRSTCFCFVMMTIYNFNTQNKMAARDIGRDALISCVKLHWVLVCCTSCQSSGSCFYLHWYYRSDPESQFWDSNIWLGEHATCRGWAKQETVNRSISITSWISSGYFLTECSAGPLFALTFCLK